MVEDTAGQNVETGSTALRSEAIGAGRLTAPNSGSMNTPARLWTSPSEKVPSAATNLLGQPDRWQPI